MFLVKLKGPGLSDGVVYVKGAKDLKERDVYLHCADLEEGEYFLFTEVDWVSSTVDTDYTVTCYGASGAAFQDESDTYARVPVLRSACEAMVSQRLYEKSA